MPGQGLGRILPRGTGIKDSTQLSREGHAAVTAHNSEKNVRPEKILRPHALLACYSSTSSSPPTASSTATAAGMTSPSPRWKG